MTNFCGINFEHPIINSSGCWVRTKEQILELSETRLAGITLKTVTLDSKNANCKPNFYAANNLIFNCMGCPNLGYNYYKDIIINKPLIISMLGNNIDELKIMLQDYNKLNNNKRLVEINISCPNLENRIPGYHCKDIIKIIYTIKDIETNNLVIGFKLPPYLEINKINKIAQLLNKHDIIKFITCSNTIPNGLVLQNQEPILSKTFGGISGKVNKYIATSNIFNFKKYLKNIQIIGCGGINSLEDIKDYLSVGASLVQIGSNFYNQNNDKLDSIKINSLIEEYIKI